MKNIVLLLAMLAAILGLASCHTTEANYKAAYDKAVEKTRENMGEDNYAHMQAARMAYTEVVNGDSVRLLRSFCNIVDGKPTDVKKFSIVVAMFDQVINARSYRDRLHTKEGFDSYIVYTAKDKKYCVVAQGYDNKGQAAAFVTHIDEYMHMRVLVPRAWILEKL